jgi:hypothetical protein
MQGEKTTCLLQLQQSLLLPRTTAPDQLREVAQLKQATMSRIKHTINKTDNQSSLKTKNTLLK